MKILSLFSGIGAFEKALENIGIKYELVGFSEIDKYAIKSYCAIHNADESLNLGDITKINISSLPKDIDLITHGSPCQDFSIAGNQAGGDIGTGTRSSLMWNTVDIVTYCLPKYVVWENVKNILSEKHRHNFDSYLEIMKSLGYNNYYQVLNAKDYGVPQNRERVYTISIRKDIDKEDFKFPEKEILNIRLKDILEDKVDKKYYISLDKTNKLISQLKNKDSLLLDISQARREGSPREYTDIVPTLSARDYKEPRLINTTLNNETDRCLQVGNLEGGKWNKINESCRRVYSKEGISPTIHTCQGGNTEPKVLNPLKGKTSNGWHFEQEIYDANGIARAVKAGGGNGNIPKIVNDNIETLQDYKIRKLTPKECWRLMGFNDNDFEKAQNIPISNTQLYKQAGNSIVVKVLEKIFINLFKKEG